MKITVDAKREIAPLGDLYGLFFEDINHAADGGLYAELVRNRSFEFDTVDNPSYNHLTAWETVIPDGARAQASIQTEHFYNAKNPHYLVMDLFCGDSMCVRNEGFNGGISVIAGKNYKLSMIAAVCSAPAAVEVCVESIDGRIYAKAELEIFSKQWQRYEAVLTANNTDHAARLAIRLKSCTRIYVDFVSLFPENTFKGRKNGMRADIAQMLADMKPRFMRFPGGCLVHDGSLNSDDRDSMYRWKNTIGELGERPARRNNWGYNQTLGLGYYEYFLFCEDIGAKPLPVLPGASDPHHSRAEAVTALDEWIADALDLIEFANGDTDTQWGAVRARLGHEEPFGLEYIGIGNEEVGEAFFERYPYFHKAIKEKFPDIKVINTAGPFVGGSEYERGWKSAEENGSDLIDEHYYLAPEWFIANHHHYDSYHGRKTKVFLGEYASWGNDWCNALAEASYMIGLERNAGTVALACYAPMLCNADYVNWQPDMIWFNNHQVYGTANYYVQKLFMTNQGDTLLASSVETELNNEILPSAFGREIYLAPNRDAVMRCEDIEIITQNGVIHCSDVTVSADSGKIPLGSSDGDYTIRMKVTRIGGSVGFYIVFDCADDANRHYIDFGGWENQDSAICECINARSSCLDQSRFSIETGKTYHIETEVKHGRITHKLNGEIMNTAAVTSVVIEPVYCTAVRDGDDIIVKAVNLRDDAHKAKILLNGAVAAHAERISLHGYADDCRNSFDEPDKISPKTTAASVEDGAVIAEIPPRSVNIFRIVLKQNATF